MTGALGQWLTQRKLAHLPHPRRVMQVPVHRRPRGPRRGRCRDPWRRHAASRRGHSLLRRCVRIGRPAACRRPLRVSPGWRSPPGPGRSLPLLPQRPTNRGRVSPRPAMSLLPLSALMNSPGWTTASRATGTPPRMRRTGQRRHLRKAMPRLQRSPTGRQRLPSSPTRRQRLQRSPMARLGQRSPTTAMVFHRQRHRQGLRRRRRLRRPRSCCRRSRTRSVAASGRHLC
jgi:hypothetical protein